MKKILLTINFLFISILADHPLAELHHVMPTEDDFVLEMVETVSQPEVTKWAHFKEKISTRMPSKKTIHDVLIVTGFFTLWGVALGLAINDFKQYQISTLKIPVQAHPPMLYPFSTRTDQGELVCPFSYTINNQTRWLVNKVIDNFSFADDFVCDFLARCMVSNCSSK